MNGNTALNALYRQYEEEKLRLELYGHISSLTFEEWLEVKQHKENSLEDERRKIIQTDMRKVRESCKEYGL